MSDDFELIEDNFDGVIAKERFLSLSKGEKRLS